MENQLEKYMGNDMESVFIQRFIGMVCRGLA